MELCQELLTSQMETKQKAETEEKEKAEEICKTDVETTGETRKRKNDDDDTSPSEKRRSGTKLLHFYRKGTEL